MMTQMEATDAVVAVTGILFIWVLVTFLYRDYRIDLFRQRMFAERDALFDYAAEGGIEFGHPAYTLVRSTMNGFIRFADRINVWGLAATAHVYGSVKNDEESFSAQFTSATKDLTPEQKDTLVKAVNRMDMHVLDQLVLGSPVLILAVIPVAAFLIVQALGKEAGRRVLRRAVPRRWSLAVDSFALDYGTETAFA
ncbi:hypothetical protein [Longimicrobium sp.]|uniref:hypothetical protein n=1 Tax=Longimicrobium sp. TaxID=2029185 RepID=UPI002E2F6727|nr:hypothetical protein [Longimicrobium sp.]HEX6039550.1 hypothetical protein [Longimicrobium sp.]